MTITQPSNNQDPTTPQLNRCPDCRYLLRGLPPSGNCPECGLFYDPLAAELRAPMLWRPLYVMPALPFLMGAATMTQNVAYGIILMLLGVALLGILVYTHPRFHITRDGVRLVSWKKSKWIPWPDISTVDTVGGRLGHLKMTSHDGSTLFWVLFMDIGGRAFALRMKGVIAAKRDAYLARPEEDADE